MIYEELDVGREEIRLLRFNGSLTTTGLSEPLSLSFENFSLDSFSEDFTTFTKGGQPHKDWHDVFSPQIEYRRGPQHLRHDTSQYVPPQVQSSTRFTWGDYEALSYAWGDGARKTHIKLNGIVTEVSCELEAALRMLHRLPETNCGMKYWIDALCIQQDNIEERNFQVKRMKKIYGTARSVVVWLGNASPVDDIALRAINDTWEDSTQNNRLFTPRYFGTDHWNALCGFIRKPYWSRLWIIQELVANSRSTLFVCGAHELTREAVKLALRCCQKLLREEAPFTCHDKEIWEISWRLLRLIKLTSEQPKDITLRKVLSLSRQAMVSVEKDKVYGILSLLDESISSQIHPDYSEKTSLKDVFTSLTIAIIKATKSVEQIVYSSQYDREWPSWVPDLRLPFRRHHMQHLRDCQAGGKRSSKFKFCQSSTGRMQLRVKGIKVDCIDGIAASPGLGDLPLLPQHRNQRYDYSSVEVLGKTLVVGDPEITGSPVFMKLPWRPGKQSARSRLWSSQEYLDFADFRTLNQNFIVSGQSLESLFPESRGRLANHGFVRYHLRKAAVSLTGRKLITTETGYIGLVPQCVQRKDIVVVLLGCSFPVLLRHYRDGYRVLGECYIHGLMAGEIFEAQRRENLRYLTLTLC